MGGVEIRGETSEIFLNAIETCLMELRSLNSSEKRRVVKNIMGD